MAIFGHFYRFWPGSYRGLFPENAEKWPFLAIFVKNAEKRG